MRKFLFAHRPPTTGVHLLSDPLPHFGDNANASRLNREHLEALKQQITPLKTKKGRSQT